MLILRELLFRNNSTTPSDTFRTRLPNWLLSR